MLVSNKSDSVISLLDTDLYKLCMQCAVLQHFPEAEVEYTFHNRTVDMRLNRPALSWLSEQIERLGDLSFSEKDLLYLSQNCRHLQADYIKYLTSFKLRPKEQVILSYDTVSGTDLVDIKIKVHGLWVETILYEIPLLALTSQAYFKFVDRDWNHAGQEELATRKAVKLLEGGCVFSEFGTRRRRDFQTQDTVVACISRAQRENPQLPGKFVGTSNVYLARKYGVNPVGTVAHEWYMAIAAITQDYERANERALKYWLETFGEGVEGIALTDTFATPSFFASFKKKPSVHTFASRVKGDINNNKDTETLSFAHIYTGVRQDSGDPFLYVKMASSFYRSLGIQRKKVLFSDSLTVEKCIDLKKYAEDHDLVPSFGIGTFFSNDFRSKSDPTLKSRPLNIVMKVSQAGGQHCVKISDDRGKNTGDADTIKDVKRRLSIE